MTVKLAKRKLVEPDYWTCPHGARVRPDPALTYGPEVANLCAKAGYAPDPQQELGLDLVFAIRPDGSPASFSFCVICARQNLKSGLFLQCVIGWLFVVEVPEIAWSAHELRTSLNAQVELDSILDSPALSGYRMTGRNRGLYDTNGKERIELNTGQIVWFQTRTRDGGRGLGKPKVIIDEAFKFKARTAGALLPILLAQYHPQLLYGSSEPPNDPDAAVLRDVMDRGKNRKSPELSYLHWAGKREPCKDPDCTHPKDALARGLDCALDREHLIRKANPTLTTGRIELRTIRNLRQELPPEEYMRECMSWEETEDASGPPAVDSRRWATLADPETPAPARAAVVLDIEPKRTCGSIGIAGPGVGGRVVLLERTAEGDAWMIPTLQRLRENVEVLEVALHPSGQAASLIPELKAAGIAYHELTHKDLGRGCSGFLTGMARNRFTHVGQSALDAAVAVARTRFVGEVQLWDRNSSVPMAPLVATSTAAHRWALLTAAPETPPPPPSSLDESGTSSVNDEANIQTVGF